MNGNKKKKIKSRSSLTKLSESTVIRLATTDPTVPRPPVTTATAATSSTATTSTVPCSKASTPNRGNFAAVSNEEKISFREM